MKAMVLIFGSEDLWQGLEPAKREEEMGAYFAYTRALREAGKLVHAHEMAPVAAARSLSLLGGQERVIDGPYVEIKEQLGGYYVLEVADMAEALQWARRCPGARHGGVEVRPLIEHEV